jgi:hypothetical protein
VLLLLGVPERTVMAVMGWASTAMAVRYQHVSAVMRRGVADQVGGLLWAPPLAGNDGPPTAAQRDHCHHNCHHEGKRRAARDERPAFSLVMAAEDAGFEPARA